MITVIQYGKAKNRNFTVWKTINCPEYQILREIKSYPLLHYQFQFEAVEDHILFAWYESNPQSHSRF